ncbi:hypothetical protein HDU77_011354 [Chytriomyces hyalinus]|nr:hypothetical protein HDU77_011354 [Chytriomyces hyalinus]
MYMAIGEIYEFHHGVKVTSLVESGFHSDSDKDSEDSEQDNDTASENGLELPEGDKDCDNKDFDELENNGFVFNSPSHIDFLDPINESEANGNPTVEAASKAAPGFHEWSFMEAAKIKGSATSASVTTSMDTPKSQGGPTPLTTSRPSTPVSTKYPSSASVTSGAKAQKAAGKGTVQISAKKTARRGTKERYSSFIEWKGIVGD